MWNYHYPLCNGPEERRSLLFLGGSLNSSEYLLHDRGILFFGLKSGVHLNLTEFPFVCQGVHRVFNTLSYSLVMCLG